MSAKKPWTTGEKLLLTSIGVVVFLVALGGLWWAQINANPVVTVPTPTMPSPNAFDELRAAATAEVDPGEVGWAIQPGPHLTHYSPSDHAYSPAEKATLVAENALALSLLHQGLSDPYLAPPTRSFTTPLPYFAQFRGLARLLFLETQVQEANDDWNGAMNSSLDAVQMGEMIPRGSPLIGMLVGIACQAIGRRQAWPIVAHLSAGQAEAAAHRLEWIRRMHTPYAEVLQGEEWSGQAGLMEILRKPDWPQAFAASDGSSPMTFRQMLLLRLTSKRTAMRHYTAYMDQSIANARRPYAAHPAEPTIPNDPISAVMCPVFVGARFKDAVMETQNALLAVTLALRAYRLDHRAYPQALNALVPHYLQAIPDDPFALTGPLRYKPQGSAYVLYSVGPDGKDDGGRPIFDPSKPGPQPDEQDHVYWGPRYWVQQGSTGDIVAGVNQS